MSRSSLDWLTRLNKQGPVLLDGGTGSLLWERLGGKHGAPDGSSSLFNLTEPSSVEAVHREFATASAQVLVTNTFGTVNRTIKRIEDTNLLAEVNSEAVRLARRGASMVSSEILISGSIGPLQPDLPEVEVQSLFTEQARELIRAGVDLLLCETMMSGRQAVLAANACHVAMAELSQRVPLVVSMVPPSSGIVPDEWAAVGELLTTGEIDLFGLNCGDGPLAVRRILEGLDHGRFGPYWIKPSAGIPRVDNGRIVYPLGPEQFAREVADMVKCFPVVAVGGCCGATPHHIHSLRTALSGKSVLSV